MAGTGASVIEQLASAQRTAELAQTTALATYVTLIVADTGTDGDNAAMTVAATTLGKGPADVSRDLAAVVKAKALVATANTVAGAALARDQIAVLVRQYALRLQAQINLLKAQAAKLDMVLANANANVYTYIGSAKALQQLKAENPGLLASIQLSPTILTQTGVSPDTNLPSLTNFLATYSEMRPCPITISDDLAFPTDVMLYTAAD